MLENVSGVEPFVESVPQSLWVLSLGFLTNECVGVNPGDGLGVCVFTTSILSACYGLTNFLRVGPLKVIPNQPASGFGHLSYYIVFFSVLCSLTAKGFVLGALVADRQFMELLLIFIPQVLFSLTTLCATLGVKDCLSLAIRHPAIVLMPIFTNFAFGPEKSNCKCRLDGKLQLHYGLTIGNITIALAEVLGILVCTISGQTFEYCAYVAIPAVVVSALLTTALILSDKCSTTSCSCAKPVRVVREIKGLLNDSQPLDDLEMPTARENKDFFQPMENIEMQPAGQVLNNQ